MHFRVYSRFANIQLYTIYIVSIFTSIITQYKFNTIYFHNYTTMNLNTLYHYNSTASYIIIIALTLKCMNSFFRRFSGHNLRHNLYSVLRNTEIMKSK